MLHSGSIYFITQGYGSPQHVAHRLHFIDLPLLTLGVAIEEWMEPCLAALVVFLFLICHNINAAQGKFQRRVVLRVALLKNFWAAVDNTPCQKLG